MPEPVHAVFLSYAREDAAAARRVAEALRAAGLEVWFDENELRGGEAWDAKIRQQINDCTLFLPIISRHTQERGKGYFRLEWKLAVEQTHLMADGMAFLAPVVIDDTRETGALVPPEFLRVQWTRLPDALPTSQFITQVKRLLAGKPAEADRPRAAQRDEGAVFAPKPRPVIPAWLWATLAAGVLVAAGVVFSRKGERPAGAPPAPVAEAKPAAPAAPVLSAKSIAVLPFANLSTEKENEFFADGVHDDVITNLAKIRDLKVISRTSVLAYRDPAARNLKKIAAELGVATVLEGSIRRVGGKVHMNAQLIDARTDEHLWADTFDGDTADIFALQAKLAQQIASALKATLSPGELSLIERRPTKDPEAYEFFLQARAIWQEKGEGGVTADYERIIALYEQAIARDPAFAIAYAQAAQVHSIMYWFGNLDPSDARAEKMRGAVEAAEKLAPQAPETHLALGAYHYRVKRDWTRALAEFRLAEAGLPNDAQLMFWLGITHRRLGKWAECVGYFEKSVDLNPRDASAVKNYVEFLLILRRWDEVEIRVARFLNYFPADRGLLSRRAEARFGREGDRAAYLAEMAALPHESSDQARTIDRYRAAYVSGDYLTADRVLAESSQSTLPEPVSSVITDPISFHRAHLAFARGDLAAARGFAEAAMVYYRETHWNARQRPWAQMQIATAEAWAGLPTEAVRDARMAFTEMSARDAFDAVNLRAMLGLVYVSVDQREDALACLRQMMQEPTSASPNGIRIGPLWSRLRDDPRFEEILKSAKPL
jgi:TolB-like protein